MITREIDYAIRALLYLALHEREPVVSTTVMAETLDIPYRFLRRISLTLVEQGLMVSIRGKQGGVRLARPAADVSLRDIVRAVDPSTVTLNACLTDRAVCDRSMRCVVHEQLAVIQQSLDEQLAGISLACLVEQERARTRSTSEITLSN